MMVRLFAAIERATRAGPGVAVGVARAIARQSVSGLFIIAMLSVMIGGQVGHTADTAAEAHIPESVTDISLNDVEREPVDYPYVPDRFEEPVVTQRDTPEWYLDGVVWFIELCLKMFKIVGDATAAFAFANKWVPLEVYAAFGYAGAIGAIAMQLGRVRRLIR